MKIDLSIKKRTLFKAAAFAASSTLLPFAWQASAQELPKAQGTVDMEDVLSPGPLPEMALGREDAPVTIIEYMSMTCPHCAAFHNETFEPIKTKYVDSGRVRFVMREFPFDPVATAAFMLARCKPSDPSELTAPDQYFNMVSMLFKQQKSWAAPSDGDVRGALLQAVKIAGFSQQTFETCLTNQTLLDNINMVMKRGADDFGVDSTPTFLINGKKYTGNMSVESMSGLIDSF